VNKEVSLTIDGQSISVPEGTTVLEAALDSGIYIPHLCYHPDLEPVGVCRVCMVEIGGRMTISCKTPVQDGMKVITDSPAINRVRKTAVELLLANYHRDCATCDKNSVCELQRVARYVGVDPEDLDHLRPPDSSKGIDTSNPFFDRDLDKCILCGICVRTCREITGVSVIDFINRGYKTTIGTFEDQPLKESPCGSCGECVVRCPVGALTPKEQEEPSREVLTTCSYCGCGCGIYLGVRGDRVVSARGDIDNPASLGRLCVKGRYGYGFVNSEDRLTKPLIKKNGEFEEVSWDEALEYTASRLSEHKGDETAVLSSAKCTNEENYIIQKFTRAVMETNNVDHCARL